MDFGIITRHDCVNAPPVTGDPRCQDPAFSLANPDICAASSNSGRLIIKPEVAYTPHLGSVQFKAFLVTNNIEQDVTRDCVWSTSDMTIALIGAASGNATGVGQGRTAITATRAGLTAEAGLMVFSQGDDCSNQSVGMMLLVDTSRSMGQTFSSVDYGTRLDFAKAGAARFASEVNEMKDSLGLMTFNDSGVTTLFGITPLTPVTPPDVPNGVISTFGDPEGVLVAAPHTIANNPNTGGLYYKSGTSTGNTGWLTIIAPGDPATVIDLEYAIANSTSSIEVSGDPEGVIAAVPRTLAYDPNTGGLYYKVTTSGSNGWQTIIAAAV